MNTRLASAFAVFTLAGLASCGAAAETTWLGSDCEPRMTPLQERLYQKRQEGGEALRRFILVRQGIVQADFGETVEWAAAVDEARSRCVRRLSQAQSREISPPPQMQVSAP